MSFLRKLGVIWFTLKQARALKQQGVMDPDELRRTLMQRAISHASGGTVEVDLPSFDADIPDEALEVWEDYSPAETITLTERHINLIRRVRFSWNVTEVGAPRVDEEQPYGSPDPLRDLAQSLGEASVTELAKRHADMTDVLNKFFRRAELEPGTYQIDGREFALNIDHLTLVPELIFDWDNEGDVWPTPSVDPKRPYGNYTFFQKEMALYLGWLKEGQERELTDDEISRLTDLHHEMLDALRVVATYATVRLAPASA
jgi:sulfur relay (sulfurtransferase) DsrC/TusE family protein